jgi:hypothetical protein
LQLALRLPLLLVDWLRFVVWSVAQKSEPTAACLCVLVGADWTSLLRGLLVAKRLGVRRKSVYVVDNIYEFSRDKAGLLAPLARVWINRLLKQYDCHYAITAGLGGALRVESGITWQPVDLPYDFDVHIGPRQLTSSASPSDSRSVLVFVGAITAYVSPMLDELLTLISTENRRDHVFELHVLSRNVPDGFLDRHRSQLASRILHVYSGVSDEQMIERYARTGILVCPYSRRPEHESFISQSFPSKLLKMVHTGLPCLLLAPPYAAVCKTHGGAIPTFEPSGDLCALKEAILKAEAEAPDLASRIQDRHDPANFMKRVLA